MDVHQLRRPIAPSSNTSPPRAPDPRRWPSRGGGARCSGERRRHNDAVWAKKLGYANVVRYVGGIKAWDEADYPVEKARD